jgi:hypothetical protein
MDILPEDLDLDDVEVEDLPTNTFLVDNESEQVAGMDDGLEAIRQAIEIMLTTERFGYQIYTENFGVELEDLIGEDADYIKATLPARIRDAFSIDDRILGERNYKFEVTGDKMLVTFDVDTVYGSFGTEVQI